MYQCLFKSFTDGSTTFTVLYTGQAAPLPVRVDASPNLGGPDVLIRMATNDAGAIIDLDGTSAAALMPPQLTFTFRFVNTAPDAHTQYDNLIALKGKHGTFTGWVHSVDDHASFTAPARLIDVNGAAQGIQYMGAPSYFIVNATWQLKDFLTN